MFFSRSTLQVCQINQKMGVMFLISQESKNKTHFRESWKSFLQAIIQMFLLTARGLNQTEFNLNLGTCLLTKCILCISGSSADFCINRPYTQTLLELTHCHLSSVFKPALTPSFWHYVCVQSSICLCIHAPVLVGVNLQMQHSCLVFLGCHALHQIRHIQTNQLQLISSPLNSPKQTILTNCERATIFHHRGIWCAGRGN